MVFHGRSSPSRQRRGERPFLFGALLGLLLGTTAHAKKPAPPPVKAELGLVEVAPKAAPEPGELREHVPELPPSRTPPMREPPIEAREIRAHLSELRACYERGLAVKPGLRGTVVSSFTIDAKGRVTAVELRSGEFSDLFTERCLEKAIRGWKFTPLEKGGEVRVSFPLVFAPGPRALSSPP